MTEPRSELVQNDKLRSVVKVVRDGNAELSRHLKLVYERIHRLQEKCRPSIKL